MDAARGGGRRKIDITGALVVPHLAPSRPGNDQPVAIRAALVGQTHRPSRSHWIPQKVVPLIQPSLVCQYVIDRGRLRPKLYQLCSEAGRLELHTQRVQLGELSAPSPSQPHRPEESLRRRRPRTFPRERPDLPRSAWSVLPIWERWSEPSRDGCGLL